ncbi:MAG: HD domain-containing protein [Candidatus Brocadiia bacterium]
MNRELPDDNAHSLGIHPRVLQPATFPPFDLYVRDELDGGFTLFRPAGEPVYMNTWRKLEENGIERFYVEAHHRDDCLDYVEEHLEDILEQDELPEDQLAQWAYLLTGRALEKLMADPDSPGLYGQLERTVRAIVRVLTTGNRPVAHMLDSAPLNYYTHFHSANVCALLGGFSHTVLGVEDPDVLTEITLGGALHDLGKVMVPDDILHKPARLTRGEFAKVTRHPGDGVEIARPFLRRQMLAQRVIVQHHENAEGGGYPEGRAGASINSFARATRVADVFDALTSHRPYGGAMDRYCALNTMASEMPGVFDERILRQFIKYAAASFRQDKPVTLAGGQTDEAEEPEPTTPALLTGPAISEPQAETPEPEPQTMEPQDKTEEESLPTVRRHIRALEDLADADEDVPLMTGILGALQEAVHRYRGPQKPKTAADEREPAPAERDRRTAEIEPVRPLFGLVWQIDAWRSRFAETQVTGQAAGRMRREMLECLDALRASVLRTLNSHHIEVVENAEDAEPTAAETERVGFIYRTDAGVELLEPPRPAGRQDRRQAG